MRSVLGWFPDAGSVGLAMLLVAVLAVLVSIWVARMKAASLKIEQQRERNRIERGRRADLKPELRRTDGGFWRLVIANHGEAEARNMRIVMDEKPLREHAAFPCNQTVPDRVGAGGEVSCVLGLAGKCAPPFKINLTWDDDSGSARTYEMTLTF